MRHARRFLEDAAEMNESVEGEAFVIPGSSGRSDAGRPPFMINRLHVLIRQYHRQQPVCSEVTKKQRAMIVRSSPKTGAV